MGEFTPDAVLALGQRIREARLAQRYTQIWLAHQAHVTKQMMNRIELGKTEPRATTLAQIALALGVTTDALLGLRGARLPLPRQDHAEGL